MENTINHYTFQGCRWVPGYNDFDFDDCTVEATNEKDAWDLLYKYTQKWTWKWVNLVYINNEKVQPSTC